MRLETLMVEGSEVSKKEIKDMLELLGYGDVLVET